MRTRRILRTLGTAALLTLLMLVGYDTLLAHCDGLDGPVVKAAEQALASGNVNHALVWVRPQDEPEVRSTFRQTLAVRGASPEARQLADRHFFETLVRLHRLGEDAPYTGLQPAGRDLGPAIPAADRAVVSGDLDELEALLTEEVLHGLHRHFTTLRDRQGYAVDDLEAGRAYVQAYVELVHYVERVHESARTESHGHYGETAGHTR